MNKETKCTIKCVAAWVGSIIVLIAISRAGCEMQTSPPVPMIAPAIVAKTAPTVKIVQAAPALPDVPLDAELIKAVVEACDKYSVPVKLALAVIEIESGYQTDAVNGACMGLYQINTDYIAAYEEALGVTDITDPVQNIESGVWYLGQLLEKHGEVNLALMHYNLGNKADRLWEQGQHSTYYTDKVNAAQERLKG